MVSVGDWARELCGGTHAERSGQLGLVKLLGESSDRRRGCAGSRRSSAWTPTRTWPASTSWSPASSPSCSRSAPRSCPSGSPALVAQLRDAEKELARMRAEQVLAGRRATLAPRRATSSASPSSRHDAGRGRRGGRPARARARRARAARRRAARRGRGRRRSPRVARSWSSRPTTAARALGRRAGRRWSRPPRRHPRRRRRRQGRRRAGRRHRRGPDRRGAAAARARRRRSASPAVAELTRLRACGSASTSGSVRVGLAACDPSGLVASPVETVPPRPHRATPTCGGSLPRSSSAGASTWWWGCPARLSGREGPAARSARAYAVGSRPTRGARSRSGWWTSV